jgi:hypothetical protein
MIYRAFLILLLSTFSCACNSESKNDDKQSVESSVKSILMAFSDSISNRDTKKLIAITAPDGIHLIRKFTSGNLGGRGEEFSSKIQISAITQQMQLAIEGQAPFSFEILFPELPIKSYEKLPHYKLSSEIDTLAFDQWIPPLAKALSGLSEAEHGDPILLVSSSNYWIYAEAQIIDGILVGGFAVFKGDSKHSTLISIIELL